MCKSIGHLLKLDLVAVLHDMCGLREGIKKIKYAEGGSSMYIYIYILQPTPISDDCLHVPSFQMNIMCPPISKNIFFVK